MTLLRADTAVAAIVGTKVSSIGESPPSIRLVENRDTRRPFGPTSGWLEEQLVSYIAFCYGVDSPTGQILARQLAGSVSDALHNKVPRKVGTAFLNRVYAPTIGGYARDPETRWPYYTVDIDVYAGAQAVA